MPKPNPWSAIEVGADSKLTALRADAKHRHDFFWARNQAGSYVFLYSPEIDPELQVELPALRGITARYYPEAKQLQLVLSQASDWELFHALCDDLLRSTENQENATEVMQGLLNRLVQWQRFLSRKTQQILDERAIRGLIAEMIFIRDSLAPKYGASSVTFWHGPEGAKQDFAVGSTLVEVKSYLAGSASKIIISSPEQLWATSGKLYLAVTRLTSVPSTAAAVTLPKLVADLRKVTDGTAWGSIFDEKLVSAGYFDLQEYEQYAYHFSELKYFEVMEGFPLLKRDAVQDGMGDISYSIQIDKCAPFAVTPEWPVF